MIRKSAQASLTIIGLCLVFLNVFPLSGQITESAPHIRAVAWSSTNILAVGGTIEGQSGLRLYENSSHLVFELSTTGNVLSIAWSPDSARIAAVVAGTPDNLYIWDINTGNTLLTISQDYATDDRSTHWSPDGSRIATARGRNILIWNSLSGQLLTTLEHAGSANSIQTFAWNTTGSQIWSADSVGMLRLWDTTTANPIVEVQSSHLVVAVAVGSIGLQVAFGDSEGNVQIRDIETGELVIDWQVYTAGNSPDRVIDLLRWSPIGDQIVASGIHGPIMVWDTVARSTVDTIQRTTGGTLEDITYSPYGGRLGLANNLATAAAVSENDNSVLEDVAQGLADGTVQIVVPDPTLERLQSIAALCDAPLTVTDAIPQVEQPAALTAFVAQVTALSEGTIPPACAADLIAVAEAIAEAINAGQ